MNNFYNFNINKIDKATQVFKKIDMLALRDIFI